MQRSPLRRCLLLRSGLRRAQLAIMTRAFVAIGADTWARVGATEGFEQDEDTGSATTLGRGERERKWDSRPASTLGAENVASKITSCRTKSASRTMRAHRREETDARHST
eukprot:1153561-Pleurochrysis_carterae.AAC.4